VNKNSKKHKFNSNTYKLFKNSITCFGPLQKRIIEGKIDVIISKDKLVFIDFGFLNEIESFLTELSLRIPEFFCLTTKCNFIKKFSSFEFKVVVLQSFFLNETIIKKHYFLNFNVFLFIFLKQKQKKKRYIKGRILNLTKGGYSIGVCGFVGFLPNSHTLLKLSKSIGIINSFYIITINKKKKNFIFSQRRMEKILKRRLLKLSSRLMYLEKFNIISTW
jgi:ribosomal protein S1